jgi:hypothetical protein
MPGYQYAIDPDSNDYCSSGKTYHLCRRRLWLRSRIKVGESRIPTIEVSSLDVIKNLFACACPSVSKTFNGYLTIIKSFI